MRITRDEILSISEQCSRYREKFIVLRSFRSQRGRSNIPLNAVASAAERVCNYCRDWVALYPTYLVLQDGSRPQLLLCRWDLGHAKAVGTLTKRLGREQYR